MDIHYTLKDNQTIQVNTSDNNRDYIDDLKTHLTDYVDGYKFMKKYKIGVWDGTISLFNRPTRTFPYGLLFDVIRFNKNHYPSLDVVISPEVKSLYKGIDISNITYNLKHQPYDYQKSCIEILLKTGKGIINVATAGGKSLIIAYLIDILSNNVSMNMKQLIVVPTKQLVNQFKGDLIDYNIDSNRIGIVDATHKEFDNNIVISTWQSLQNQMDVLPAFDTVIIDECHSSKAEKLSGILKECTNARFRFGCTGTMPQSRLDKLNVMSYLGPVLKIYTGRHLADLGYISKCTVTQIHIKYKEKYNGDYTSIKDQIFFNNYRLSLIAKIIEKSDNSVLILVDKVEKEGEPLYDIINNKFKETKDVIFLSGRDKSDIREEWRKKINTNSNIVCIATYQIFQQGINIPSLRTIILASSTKSYVRVIQSLGRTLRKHVSKALGGALLYDICDDVKYLKDHAGKRNRHYTKEQHDIVELSFDEDDIIDI